MLVKNIICEVDTKFKHDFSVAQEKWSKLRDCEGFIAQYGGWNSANLHQAFITSIWKNEEFYQNFMSNTHDLILNKSNQHKTYQKIEVKFNNSDDSEKDVIASVRKVVTNNYFYINSTKILLEKSWNVFSKKIYFLFVFLFFFGYKSEAQHLPKDFVYIKEVIPSIELELRYTMTNNFVGKPIEGYKKPKGILTKQAAEGLKKVQLELKEQNLGLKIFDAYRPQRAVNHFMSWVKKPNDTLMKRHYYPTIKKNKLLKEQYIASKSGHSRGSTVDITIIDLTTKQELDMGSIYDFFGKESWVSYQNLTPEQLENRKLLQSVMQKHYFRNYPQEWWHFTLRWEPFPNTYFDFDVE